MTAKEYLERKIKDMKMEIEMTERQFDELTARETGIMARLPKRH